MKNLFLLCMLIAALGLILTGRVTAQTFTTLHSFTLVSGGAYPGGRFPYGGLILSSNTLYGTTLYGGNSDNGTVFAINTNGTGFSNLHSFTATSGPSPYTNSDGATPYAGLLLSSNTLYGTAYQGGSSGYGTVFKVNTDGSGFTTLYSFTGSSDGANPSAELIISGNTLYGTSYGGNTGYGTVFKVNTDGTGFTRLHGFTDGSDGGWPQAGLILSGNTLYGTALVGGGLGSNPYGDGTVFKVNTDGSDFTTIHKFTDGSDGHNPYARLVLSGNTLYGTAFYGGSSIPGNIGYGTVFKVNTDGTGFTTLHSFTATSNSSPYGNSDGANPQAGLFLSGNNLYGTARYGGNTGYGTVFQISNDGASFTTLHSFNSITEGAYPYDGLILSGNTLYGTAYTGGSGEGAVFSLLLPSPQLTIIPSGTNVDLMWPTNAAGFTLQSTTNLAPPAVWTPVSPAPVVINGQDVVTNAITGTQMFYRLSQ